MREVRFRLSASKNFMKEKKMCLTHEFLDPFVSRVASECFFFFPLFLSKLKKTPDDGSAQERFDFRSIFGRYRGVRFVGEAKRVG